MYGAHKGTQVAPGILEAIQKDLQESGIKAEISPDINRGYICQMVVYLGNGCHRSLLRRTDGRGAETGKSTGYIHRRLSTESAALGRKLGVEFPERSGQLQFESH